MSRTELDKQREHRVEKYMNRCSHFTGIQNATCKAGVNYHALLGTGAGCFAHMPCFVDEEGTVKCDLRVLPTRVQAEAHELSVEIRTKKFLKAVTAAHQHAKENGLELGNGGRGELTCPVCAEGMLRYTVASVNGHMHAACTTQDCMRWTE